MIRTHTFVLRGGRRSAWALLMTLTVIAACESTTRSPAAPSQHPSESRLAAATSAGPTISGLKPSSVTICHRTGGGERFVAITVAESALPAHLAHGDGRIGGPVPGQPGMVFTAECEATPAVPPTSEIRVPLTGRRSGFGELGAAFLGQTFVAIGSAATQLTIYVGPTTDPEVRFRVLITEVRETPAFGPTNVLFESGTLTKSLSFPLEPQAFTVNLGGLPLQPGRTYAIVLDACSEFDGALESTDVGMDLGASYTGGVFFSSLPNPTQPVPCDRSLLFAAGDLFWTEIVDLAFTLTFGASSGLSAK